MPDRKKVIEGLEAIHSFFGFGLPSQSPTFEAYQNILTDAIAILKESDAKWIYEENETGVDGWRCSKCNFFEPWFYEFNSDINFIKRYERCPKCGRRMISYTGKQEDIYEHA